ncbi:MAG TPA: hypothetical protein VMD59_14370 [Acidimicrobiales bacterium]|nr:hypothetical protein [Acidimicrobiales bacterium]
MARTRFNEGEAGLATIERGVLKVPLHRDAGRAPVYVAGFRVDNVVAWTEHARIRLTRLARVDYDSNDRARWFDLADRDGRTLRLLFPVGQLTAEEAAVLAALREHVDAHGPLVDPPVRRALGIADPP